MKDTVIKDRLPAPAFSFSDIQTVVRPLHSVLTALGPSGSVDAVVVIPAQNEGRRIAACLEALSLAISRARPTVTAVCVVVNNTQDDTSRQVMLWALNNSDVPVYVFDCELAPDQTNAGAARRIGLDLSRRRLGPDGVMMTTDADSRVRTNWITANLRELARADLVCGAFVADEIEACSLPVAVARHCKVETAYLSVAVRLAALLDPRAHDPDPPHLNASGASLAFTRKLYDAVGGMPVVEMSEDRAFAALAERHDFRVRHCASAMVYTSCRMTGRTSGGMAGALRDRAVDPDPFVDEWLESATTFARRHLVRGLVRAAWPNPMALRSQLVGILGLAEALRLLAKPLPATCGAFLERVDAQAPSLVRMRMRMSQCRAQLPRLMDLHTAYASLAHAVALPELKQRWAQ